MPRLRAALIAFFPAIILCASEVPAKLAASGCPSLPLHNSVTPADAEKFCQWTVRYTPISEGIAEPTPSDLAAKPTKSKTFRSATTGPIVRIPRRY